MPAIAISAFIGAATLAGRLAGLFLQSFLPEKHTTYRSRDMLAAIVGLISLLLALVLGTLIGSAFTFYSTQKSAMETLAARSLQLDLSLAQYGPEAMPLRSALRNTLAGIEPSSGATRIRTHNSSRRLRFSQVCAAWWRGSRP
jgi:formate hydrogenlyase subunit 3/multisubunit Na+/H+ antiporter MnhD subunit